MLLRLPYLAPPEGMDCPEMAYVEAVLPFAHVFRSLPLWEPQEPTLRLMALDARELVDAGALRAYVVHQRRQVRRAVFSCRK